MAKAQKEDEEVKRKREETKFPKYQLQAYIDGQHKNGQGREFSDDGKSYTWQRLEFLEPFGADGFGLKYRRKADV